MNGPQPSGYVLIGQNNGMPVWALADVVQESVMGSVLAGATAGNEVKL
jgi:hypothetical protein